MLVRHFLPAACLCLLSASLASAQTFSLHDQTGRQDGAVTLAGTKLTLISGTRTDTFERNVALDTPESIGFELPGANLYVRWPIAVPGTYYQGRLQGDKISWDTTRLVRAAGAAPGVGPGVGVGPVGPPVGPGGPLVDPIDVPAIGVGPGFVPAVPVWMGPLARRFLPPRGARTLLGERLIPNPPLPDALVKVSNTHSEQLIVSFIDLTDPTKKPKEILIKPTASQTFQLKRDAGAKLERTYEVVTQARNVVQQVVVFDIPPQPIYDVLVWEYKQTYTVIGQPELNQMGRRSLAVLHLPAGDRMPAEIDAYEDAVDAGNPGEVAAYVRPQARGTAPRAPKEQ
jgi:hypothetical protein